MGISGQPELSGVSQTDDRRSQKRMLAPRARVWTPPSTGALWARVSDFSLSSSESHLALARGQLRAG